MNGTDDCACGRKDPQPPAARPPSNYAPFGQELYTGLFLPNERFAELTRDGEAGQDYAEARMYQPRTGRFNAPDRIFAGVLNPQSWNRYAYSLGNPGSYVDPSGLWPMPCFLCGGGSSQPPPDDSAQNQNSGGASGDAGAEGMLSIDDIHAAEAAGFWGWVDGIQNALDAASIAMDVSGIGAPVSWVPDVINGLASGLQGDWWGLGLSGWAAVPYVGLGGNAARLTRNARKLSASGRVIPVPESWISRVADNGKGLVYQAPGASGNANMIRIMEPTPGYPDGYMRIYNGSGQPINPATGKPGSQTETHIPLNYTGVIIWPWQ